MRRWGRVALLFAITFAISGPLAAQEQEPTSGWGELPETAAFEPIRDGSLDDLTTAAALVRVSRQTWGPEGNVGGACFDMTTGGPEVIYVESGVLRYHVGEPIRDVDTRPVAGLPLLVRADGAGDEPVVIVPDTWLDLQAGDLVAMPNGTDCGKYGQPPEVTFLMIEGFPAGPAPRSHAGLEMTSEPLDVDLGVPTALPAAPPSIVVGRLTVEPSASIALGEDTAPLLFAVETGTLELTIRGEGGLVRRADTERYAPSQAISPEKAVTLSLGDAAYVPPASSGSLTNTGDDPLTLFSVAVVPEAATAAPTP